MVDVQRLVYRSVQEVPRFAKDVSLASSWNTGSLIESCSSRELAHAEFLKWALPIVKPSWQPRVVPFVIAPQQVVAPMPVAKGALDSGLVAIGGFVMPPEMCGGDGWCVTGDEVPDACESSWPHVRVPLSAE